MSLKESVAKKQEITETLLCNCFCGLLRPLAGFQLRSNQETITGLSHRLHLWRVDTAICAQGIVGQTTSACRLDSFPM